MNRRVIRVMLFVTGLAVAAVTSEDTAAHKVRMDDAQDLKADIKDALDAKALAKAAAPADKLVKLCRDEEQYWVKSDLSDAVELARRNLSEASLVASAATQGGLAEARVAFDKLEATCRVPRSPPGIALNSSQPTKGITMPPIELQALLNEPPSV